MLRTEHADALQESEARLRAIVDTAVEGIITIESANPAAGRLFGYSNKELLGESLKILMPSPHREAHDSYLANYKKTGKAKVIGIGREVMGQRKDGTTFPIDLSVTEIKLATRRIYTGVVRDITACRQVERELRQSQERYEMVLSGAHEGIWDWDIKTNEVYYSEHFKQMLGFAEHEIPNTYDAWQSRIHPADKGEVLSALDDYLQRRTKNYLVEYRLRHKDLSYRWVLTRGVALWDSQGKAMRMAGSHKDITERKQANEMILRSEANLAKAQQIAHLGSYEYSVVEPFEAHWSAETFRILGIFGSQPELLPGEYIQRFVHPEDQERIRQVDAKILREKTPYQVEYRVIRANGLVRYVQSNGEPVFDRNGSVIKIVGTVMDISERKRLEKKVLEISEEEQSRIGQDLHDDVCQQLAGITMRCHAIYQKLKRKSMQEAKAVTEIARLINKTMQQTRNVARGLSPVMLKPDGLMSALEGLAANTRKVFRVICRFDCPSPVPIQDNVVGTHLFRIAQEALHNAVRHGKATRVEINLKAPKGQIVLKIKDNGCGLGKGSKEHKGMGIRTMNHRAGMIGGFLTLDRNGKRGTVVTCSLNGPETQKRRKRKE